jgi:hypothetical protein
MTAMTKNLSMRPKPARKTRVLRNRTGAGAMANIPLQMAYTKQQTSSTRPITVSFSDMLDGVVVGPTTAAGTTWQYPLNPLKLAGTRMQAYAALYGKFRFKRMRLCVGVNAPTTISGNYMAGYFNNPDFDIPSGPQASRVVYAQPNTVNKPWWQRGDIDARLVDAGKWYNIDADSSEIMQTTQGKFVIVNVSPPSTTSSTTIPIFVDYTIEFSEPAINAPASTGPAALFPAGTFTQTLVGGVYTFVPATGETVSLPTFVPGSGYAVFPPFQMIANNTGDNIDCSVMTQTNTMAPFNYGVYESISDYNKQTPFATATASPQQRCQVSILN